MKGPRFRPCVYRSLHPDYPWFVGWAEPVQGHGWAFCEEGFMTWDGAIKCALALASNLLYAEGK